MVRTGLESKAAGISAVFSAEESYLHIMRDLSTAIPITLATVNSESPTNN